MIVLFIVTDSTGKAFRFTTTCAPSTTGIGAVNILQSRLGIPSDVKIELRLENDVLVRHLTAPLTSLRKQRGGVAKVVRLDLFVRFTGPEESLRAIDYSGVEEYTTTANDSTSSDGEAEGSPGVAGEAAHSEEREGSGSKDLGSHADVNGETDECSVAGAPMTARVVKVSPPVRVAAPAVSSRQASTSPSPAGTHAASAAATTTVRIKRPPSRSLAGTVGSSGAERVQIRMPAEATAAAVPKTAAAPVSPAADEDDRYDREAEELLEKEPVRQSAAAAAPAERGYARKDIPMAGIIRRAYPQICEDETQAVLFIRDDTRLFRRPYRESFTEKSAVDGMSDADYAKCVSLAHIYGLTLRASAGVAAKVALYPEMVTLRHSCRPNASVHYETYVAPYAASCRCASFGGIEKGAEITLLYPHADSLPFLLLSCERRRNLLRKRYFFECRCPRCSATTNKVSDPEAALSGCQFADSSIDTDPVRQQQLSDEMRRDFDALSIMDDEGLEISLCQTGNIPPVARAKRISRLLGFIRKYGSGSSALHLHDHHWRMNLARAAYIFENVRHCAVQGATPEARERDPNSRTLFTPSKIVFDLCLKQLVAESVFIPAGHPHRLTTYESFKFLVGVLPPVIAQSVMSLAKSTSRIPWDELEATRKAWDLQKRTSLPLRARPQKP